MKKMYVLLQYFEYEGYSSPHAVWSYKPSKQEIFDILAPLYVSDIPTWKHKTPEEIKDVTSKTLWKSIQDGDWVVEECVFVN